MTQTSSGLAGKGHLCWVVGLKGHPVKNKKEKLSTTRMSGRTHWGRQVVSGSDKRTSSQCTVYVVVTERPFAKPKERESSGKMRCVIQTATSHLYKGYTHTQLCCRFELGDGILTSRIGKKVCLPSNGLPKKSTVLELEESWPAWNPARKSEYWRRGCLPGATIGWQKKSLCRDRRDRGNRRFEGFNMVDPRNCNQPKNCGPHILFHYGGPQKV